VILWIFFFFFFFSSIHFRFCHIFRLRRLLYLLLRALRCPIANAICPFYVRHDWFCSGWRERKASCELRSAIILSAFSSPWKLFCGRDGV
jgi:hypothetical protein